MVSVVYDGLSTCPKCEFNMDNLSKPELLTLLSIMEGELEARDLVIEALRAQRKEVFLQDRYGHYTLTDPFLALQRDFDCRVPGGDKERRLLGSSPISVLEAVMAHCRKMQERMSAQLAAAESRQKRLEMEKLQLQSLEQEHRKLTAQLKDEREKNKHIVMMLVRECKQLATRVVEESQRFDELQARLDEESRTSGRLQEELGGERQRSQQMEAKMEKQLSEFDTECEQLRARLGRVEAESQGLRQQVEQLRTERGDEKDDAGVASPAAAAGGEPAAATSTPPKPKAMISVSIATESISCQTASCQTDVPLTEAEGPKKTPLSIPAKPAPANYVGLSLPKTTGRGIVHSSSGGLAQTENGSEGQTPHGLPTGVSPRVQAARYKFQEQDQNGTASQSPPARDLSPTNRDNFAAKQQARHTVTQVLSRFTSPPAGGAGPLRPGLPHSASEGGPFPGRLSHPIGLKSPTVTRIDRGNPPPIPPKKPGLSQTPSPPHPSIKVVGDSSRSPGSGLKPATPQLPPKPALDLVPALTASQVGACPRSPGSPSSIHPPSTSSSISAPSSCSSRASAGSPLATFNLYSSSSLHPAGWCPSVVSSLSSGGPAALDSRHLLLLQAASQGNVTLLSMLITPTTSPTDINGQTECVKLLLSAGLPADILDGNGFTPLHFAAAHGHASCVEVLLASRAAVDPLAAQGQTPLFLACEAGSLNCAQALLTAGANRSLTNTDGCTALHAAVRSGHVDVLRLLLHHSDPSDPPDGPALSAALLNQANSDGWTPAHMAAALGLKECLEVLCSHSEQDIERRDKCNRTIHDVATDDCKDLLENLGECSSFFTCALIEPLCLFLFTFIVCEQSLKSCTSCVFPSIPMSSLCLPGDTEWLPGQELSLSPWDLVRKPLSQSSSEWLLWVQTRFVFLFDVQVEQYGNLFFHGLEGSCQEYIANLVAHCVKVRATAGFREVSGYSDQCVVVLLEGVEKASSLTGLLGDLCLSLDNRGSASPLILSLHHVRENSFLIGTLSKSRLQGSELRLQQHFRWVMLRWDQEPLYGLLGRHLRRKLLHKVGQRSGCSRLCRIKAWMSQVWQQLNACLSRLGTHEALLGPQLFLSCPVVANNTQPIVRWLARLWNAVVVPRVEGAVISRVTTKRSTSSPSQRPSPSNCGLSAGQQAVVKAALSILVNKAVMPGCPLPRHEMDRYLLEFQGGLSPLPALSSCREGSGGGRRGRDGSKLRRSNTSPRKKGSPSVTWSSGGSFREGQYRNDIIVWVCRQPAGLPVFFDDETDLIRELQTMCSSRSEPDISQVVTHQSGSHTPVSSSRRSSPRIKSQLPIPNSRGQQTRASSACSSSNNNQTQTPPNLRRAPASSSRTKQNPPNNNFYRNSMNERSRSQDDIWILHRDLHHSNQ
uniref:Cortactin-binding protein 2 n=1 Tax=Poecilia latipinna TaxID=48699 RepID=A0A3B3VQ00_9TELE